MSFHFKRKERLPEGVKRLLLSELDRALELLSADAEPLDHRVHEARKSLKRVRALLVLAAGSVAKGALDRERERARAAAHALAELRGRAALRDTYRSLLERYPDALPLEAEARLERALGSEKPVSAETAAPALAAAREELLQTRALAERLELDGKGFAVVERGFRRTYARARRAFRLAAKTRGVEHFHEFRKHEKRHFYQLQLFEKVWPKLVRVEAKELDRLGEHLGEHHDLSLLLSLTKERAGDSAESLEPPLLERRRQLEQKIVARAARLFTETPKSRKKRFAGYHAALSRKKSAG